MVTNVRKRLAVRGKEAWKLDVAIFISWKVSELEVKRQYQIKFSNRFSAFEKLSSSEEIDRTWKSVKENNKTSATGSTGLYELQQHKLCFD